MHAGFERFAADDRIPSMHRGTCMMLDSSHHLPACIMTTCVVMTTMKSMAAKPPAKPPALHSPWEALSNKVASACSTISWLVSGKGSTGLCSGRGTYTQVCRDRTVVVLMCKFRQRRASHMMIIPFIGMSAGPQSLFSYKTVCMHAQAHLRCTQIRACQEVLIQQVYLRKPDPVPVLVYCGQFEPLIVSKTALHTEAEFMYPGPCPYHCVDQLFRDQCMCSRSSILRDAWQSCGNLTWLSPYVQDRAVQVCRCGRHAAAGLTGIS